MDTLTSSLAVLNALRMPPPKGGEVREWFRIFPYREAVLHDRDVRLFYDDPDALIAASLNAEGRVHVDIDHASMAPGEGGDTRAYGYIVEMEERSDGLWARFDWNEAGAALMRDRAFWGLSPVLAHDDAGKITRVVSVALTNNPALRELAALTKKKDTRMNFQAKVAEQLGLAADASEEDILAALGKGIKTDDDAMEALTKIGGAVGLGGDAAPAAILTAVTAIAGVAEGSSSEVAALTAKVADLEGREKRREAEAFVDNAIREGRDGVKAAREDFIALHMSDAASAQTIVSKLTKTPARMAQLDGTPPSGGEAQAALTSDHEFVARSLGLKADDLLTTINDRNKEAL